MARALELYCWISSRQMTGLDIAIDEAARPRERFTAAGVLSNVLKDSKQYWEYDAVPAAMIKSSGCQTRRQQ